MKLDHLGIVVSDCAKSERFYIEALGCIPSSRWQNDEIKAINLQCNGLIIELLEYVNPSQPHASAGVVNHLAFKVEDLEAQIKRLTELGAAFETAVPKFVSSHKKIIFFHGPDGERIELVEEE
jgi:catechol 2,3-dioxygenase-like lactoylglutathione lyase family enzyme